ncbi:Histone-lysine N-methyltransferase setd3 [Thelohanellus kitauei]|uniref:protein-histidine N-methyltransferase n=1 Tax=Thelohanellus kitauei TaxID=669202 RepID=A0A0C2N1M3_THEKT|nr:Histone-lysine N-methyltransferase setd3 [Thelohanellus kitauei]
MTEVTETKSEQASEQNLNIFMRNITQIMDRLEEIQKKIGPPDFGNTGTGLKGSLLKLFEACCPLSRKQSDDQLWEEHQRIRTLLEDEFIPKSNNISDTFSRRNRSISIETLFDDLVKSGANLSKLRLEFVGGEVRVIAKENIDPMTPLAMIPTSSIILADFFSQHEGLNHLVNKDPILSSMHNILLAYGLLIEFYRGQDSSFYNYIQALPDCYENSYYYSLEDLKLLRGSASFRDALNNWKSAVRQYAYFHLKIVETMEGGEDLKDRQYMEKFQIASRFCFEDYRWAVATVAAKSLSIPSLGPHSINLALIPIIDLLKHSNTVTSFNYESQERLLVVSNGFEMLSGEEVSIFYGARTNSQFVLNHGFFYEENIHEFCMIRIPLKDTSTKVVKHSLLGKLGISELNGIPWGNVDRRYCLLYENL